MSNNDDFWDDLLGHIRQQILVPVVGPYVNMVKVGDAEQPLTTLIGQRLAEKYDLTLPSGPPTMEKAVAEFLRERGQDDRLYRVIFDVVREYTEPGTPLCDLAAIDDLRFFVSTNPDRLLAEALNRVRFQGKQLTREIPNSTTQATSKQLGHERPPTTSETVVLNFYGRAVSTPGYAIHEEDRLEFLHTVTERGGLPEWLDDPLRRQPMLFIGCEIPDWIGRYLLRVSSSMRLSMERKPFFFVGSSTSYEPSLSNFFATYCRKSLFQHLEMEPAAFVAELRTRWEQEVGERPSGTPAPVPPAPVQPAIFISYMREDVDAARRLHNAITELGGDVWMDERDLQAGDAWEDEILTAIDRTVGLFVPIISANTEQAQEGYVFKEWHAAVDRAKCIMGRRFIVPVIVDADYEGDPSRYQRVPREFQELHFGRAPGGDPDEELIGMLTTEIRAMRRIDVA